MEVKCQCRGASRTGAMLPGNWKSKEVMLAKRLAEQTGMHGDWQDKGGMLTRGLAISGGNADAGSVMIEEKW